MFAESSVRNCTAIRDTLGIEMDFAPVSPPHHVTTYDSSIKNALEWGGVGGRVVNLLDPVLTHLATVDRATFRSDKSWPGGARKTDKPINICILWYGNFLQTAGKHTKCICREQTN